MAPRAHAMTALPDLQRAILRLAPRELAELLTWIDDYRAQMWDRQAQSDLDTSRLDALLAEIAGDLDGPSLQTV